MQKIVIDTNVIVSALIQKSYPNQIINDLFLEDKFQLCISEELMAEYYEVLARPKFAKFQDFFIRAESLLVDIESKANFIITGNTNDFTFSTYKKTKIVTPKEYWENNKPD